MNGQDGLWHCRHEEQLQEHMQHLLKTDAPTNHIRDTLAADADNNNTDRPGDADNKWRETWSTVAEGGSSMGADAAS